MIDFPVVARKTMLRQNRRELPGYFRWFVIAVLGFAPFLLRDGDEEGANND